MENEMLIYRSADGSIKIDVRMGEETVWLTQDQMAALFGKAKSTINEHLKNIFSEGELVADSVIRNFRTTAADGKSYDTNYYNLDVIISVGYRVKSHQGTQFRIWATQVLREYLIKGFALNDERMKSGKSMNYFDELQERIREIRLSERVFYQKVKDIYTHRLRPESRKDGRVFQNRAEQTIMGHQQPDGRRAGRPSCRCPAADDGHDLLRQERPAAHHQSRCRNCQKLPDRRRDERPRAAGRTIPRIRRKSGAAAGAHVYGRLDQEVE